MATSKGRFGFFGSKNDKGEKKIGGSPSAPLPPSVVAQLPTTFVATFGAKSEVVSIDPSIAYELSFGGALAGDVVVPENMTAHNISSAGVGAVRLAGGSPGALSYGRTEGFSIRVPDEFEAGVSGRRVLVKIVARSGSEAASDFFVAYSTAEVGNSTWVHMQAGPQFQSYEFGWDVPPMDKGMGDFVGILPGPGATVDVSTLRVEVVDRA